MISPRRHPRHPLRRLFRYNAGTNPTTFETQLKWMQNDEANAVWFNAALVDVTGGGDAAAQTAAVPVLAIEAGGGPVAMGATLRKEHEGLFAKVNNDTNSYR